jgi:hypothetical protein
MEAITPPLQLWGYHRALTGFLRELHSVLTFAEDMPIVGLAALFNTDRYEDELRSIRFWSGVIPESTRRALKMGNCPTGL